MSGADLCKMCGLCCNGTLFGAVRLLEDEPPRRRLPVQRDDAGLLIRLPCPAHDGVCTIYEDRPAICRTYRCLLLSRLEAGEIELADATARVSKVKELVVAIAPLLPPAEEGTLWERVRQLSDAPIAWKQANADRLLEIARLRAMVTRFIDPKSG